MSNVAIDLTKTVKEIITTMKTAIDNLNSDVATNKTAIDNLKTQILEAVYPVGSVYVSLTNSSNPEDILGFGTWEALPAGYGLVAQGTATAEDGSTLTFTAGSKTGEFKHQLTVGELPGRTVVSLNSGTTKFYSIPWNTVTDKTGWGATSLYDYKSCGVETSYNLYHNNISPSLGCYVWQRKL